MEVMFDADSVADAIASSRKSLESREAVINYFQNKYPGQKTLKNGSVRYEWKEKIVDAELALNPGTKRASLSRRYQKDTRTGKMRFEATQPSKSQQQQYKELSSMIAKQYRVRGTLCVKYSPGICETRKIDISFTGVNAKALGENPDLQSIFNMYQYGKAQPDTMALTQAGGSPCESEDRENPKRPGHTIKGCKPSLFVTANWA